MAIIETGTEFLSQSTSLGTTSAIRHTAIGSWWAEILSGNKKWTGAKSPGVYVDAIINFPYALSGYDMQYIFDLSASYTSDYVKVHSNIQVIYWINVAGVKVYPGNPQKITSDVQWGKSYIPA